MLPFLVAVATATLPLSSKATLQWVDDLVIRLGLCPWATRDPARGFRLVACHDADTAMETVVREAAGLTQRARDAQRVVWPTTLVVVDDPRFDDVGPFATFCRSAEQSIKRDLVAEEDKVMLLGFHPRRLDSGPGCLPDDASDAGHFAVRSPYPLVQVLREVDLAEAREQYAARRAGSEDGYDAKAEPGALGLLLLNKQRLREVGAVRLQQALDACADRGDEQGDRGP